MRTKAADKVEAARAKIPRKKKKVRQRTVDPATGKKKTQLRFEEVDKPAPASKLTHAVTAAPGQTISSRYTEKSGKPRRTMWVLKAPIRQKKLLKPAHTWHSRPTVPISCALPGCGAGREAGWKRPMSMRCIRNPCRRIRPLPAIPYPAGAKTGHQEAVCRRKAYWPDSRDSGKSCGEYGQGRKKDRRGNEKGSEFCSAASPWLWNCHCTLSGSMRLCKRPFVLFGAAGRRAVRSCWFHLPMPG